MDIRVTQYLVKGFFNLLVNVFGFGAVKLYKSYIYNCYLTFTTYTGTKS